MTSHRAVVFLALAILAIVVVAQLLAVLSLNDGRFVYSLDDPYIHLALADQIRIGQYGINAGEAAAPSSTIIWPFLLAPFMGVSFEHHLPLIINVGLAAATLIVYARVCFLVICPCEETKSYLAVGFLTVLLIPASNLVGLAFTGMEHSLQLFLTALLVLGLITESREDRVTWWLLAALILGPLVRYENLALSVPALIYLLLRGRARPAALAGSLIAVLIIGFSVFLGVLGLNPIPSSVRAKSILAFAGGDPGQILGYVYANLSDVQGTLLALGFLLLMLVALSSKGCPADRLLAGAISLGIALHFIGGDFDGYHRYEIYIWTATCLALIFLYRAEIRQLVNEQPFYKSAVVLLLIAIVTGREYASVLVTNPLAANNIYQQQYQMHRFAADLYKGPVAVVDLGWVAYQNDNYVLDLWGLTSERALQERTSSDPNWMNELAQEHNVKVAMIYNFRFGRLPQNWLPIGVLQLGARRMTVADDSVTFYALDRATADRLQPLLEDYRQSLPEGVAFYPLSG